MALHQCQRRGKQHHMLAMMMDILTTNRQQVLEALARYRTTLEEIERTVKNAGEELPVLLEKANKNYQKLIDREM